MNSTPLEDWSSRAGDSALQQVQYLASKVAESTGDDKTVAPSKSVAGTGGVVYNNVKYNKGAAASKSSSELKPDMALSPNSKREEQVWTALANLELDSKYMHT